MKRQLLTAAVITLSVAAYAQKDNTPQKNDFTVAVTLEHNAYINASAFEYAQPSYTASALNTGWNDKKLMLGFEAGWFVSDDWKLSLGGGFNFRTHPGYDAVEGTGFEPTEGDIPTYNTVGERSNYCYRVFLEGDRYYNTGANNLKWYWGIRANYAYAQDRFKAEDEYHMGCSIAETFSLGGAAVVGVDYFVCKGVFIGASVAPVAYTYNYVNYVPQAGLGKLSADNHNISAFAAPTLKVGFVFGK